MVTVEAKVNKGGGYEEISSLLKSAVASHIGNPTRFRLSGMLAGMDEHRYLTISYGIEGSFLDEQVAADARMTLANTLEQVERRFAGVKCQLNVCLNEGVWLEFTLTPVRNLGMSMESVEDRR